MGIEIDNRAKIYIISPVTVKVAEMWTGYYDGRKIRFNIEDEEFLEQVYEANIDFNANTYIYCKLKIQSTSHIKRLMQAYTVLNVFENGEEYEQLKTVKYKQKPKVIPLVQQISLFDDL